MNEVMLGGFGGGRKTITLDNCTVVRTNYGPALKLPEGVTWGSLKEFLAYANDDTFGGAAYKKIDGKLKTHNGYGNWSVAMFAPSDTDDEFRFHLGSPSLTPIAMMAILK